MLLVGAGKVALAKLDGLLQAGAQVTVVAPEIHGDFEGRELRLVRRGFEAGDLAGAWLVVAAAPAAVNREVAAAAEGARVFVNAVDDPKSGSVYTGGVFRRGGVTIATSTEGQAPALAGLLREALEALIPEDIARWVDQARVAREKWRAEGRPMGQRRPLLLAALNQLYERKAREVAQ